MTAASAGSGIVEKTWAASTWVEAPAVTRTPPPPLTGSTASTVVPVRMIAPASEAASASDCTIWPNPRRG